MHPKYDRGEKPKSPLESKSTSSRTGILGGSGHHCPGAASAKDGTTRESCQHGSPERRPLQRSGKMFRVPAREKDQARLPDRFSVFRYLGILASPHRQRSSGQAEGAVVLESHPVPAGEGHLAFRGTRSGHYDYAAVPAGAGYRLELSRSHPRLELPGAQQQASGSWLVPAGVLSVQLTVEGSYQPSLCRGDLALGAGITFSLRV